MGLFQGNIGQIISRLTWELPQTLLGYASSGFSNWGGDVENVNYYDGATVVTHKSGGWGAFTLGSYINGDSSIRADPYNSLFQHEYGHYLQSQKFGLLYLGKFAIPSIINGMSVSPKDHHLFGAEQDANSRAYSYFSSHVQNYNANQSDWDSYNNPINGYDFSKSIGDSSNQLALSGALNNLKWYDIPLFVGTGMVGSGFIQSFIQPKKK